MSTQRPFASIMLPRCCGYCFSKQSQTSLSALRRLCVYAPAAETATENRLKVSGSMMMSLPSWPPARELAAGGTATGPMAVGSSEHAAKTSTRQLTSKRRPRRTWPMADDATRGLDLLVMMVPRRGRGRDNPMQGWMINNIDRIRRESRLLFCAAARRGRRFDLTERRFCHLAAPPGDAVANPPCVVPASAPLGTECQAAPGNSSSD